jgi:addiction module RelE/StbE family toxin
MRKIQFTRQSKKSLDKLIKNAPEVARMLATQIEMLRDDPTPRNSTKITGYSCHRVRVGSYRIIYEFDDKTLLVTVVEKRDKVYQKLRRHYS